MELAQKLATTDPKSYLNFEDAYKNILDKHASTKQKTVKANHKPYVSKGPFKMYITRLRGGAWPKRLQSVT